MHSTLLVAASLLAALASVTTANSYAIPFQNQRGRSDLVNDKAEPLAALGLFPRASADEPASKQPRSFSVPLKRQHGGLHPDVAKRDPEKTMAWAFRQGELMRAKYGVKAKTASKEKRQTIGLTGVGQDSYYYAQLSIGIPAQNFNVILDTGSADFWIVDSACGPSKDCAEDLNRYNPSASSTHIGSSTEFQVSYGTGAVEGTLAADQVGLAGYTVHNLTFAQADAIAQGTIDAPSSGIMGMGFQTLASSGATPFWEVLVKQEVLETNAFTFQLARNVDNVDITSPNVNSVLNPGGVFTLGKIDPQQYTGDITYIDIPNNLERVQGLGYWTIPMQGISVNGQQANIGNNPLAAIDTGTTLVGGPQAVVRAVYSLIPGSTTAQGMSGYYLFPCNSQLDIEFNFGGRNFRMAVADMNLGPYPFTISSTCLGAFFDIDLGSDVYGVPDWIVGDSFLKNVFSVYDYNGRVGLASLTGSEAQTAAITTGAVPSGSALATATASVGADGGVPIPSLASTTFGAGATVSDIVGGNGLPLPSAEGGVMSSDVALSPGRSSGSEGGSSGASRSLPITFGFGMAALAFMAGAGFVL